MTAKADGFGAGVWQMTLMGLRYLNGRRLRTILTTLAIVFGVALIFAINLVLPSALASFKQSLSNLSGADLTLTSVSGESFAPDAVLPAISGVPQVQAVSGVLRRGFSLPNLRDSSLGGTTQITLIGIDPASAQAVRQFPMSEGRFLEAGDSGAAVFPAGIADFAPELKVGTTFPLITAGGLRFFTVVGLLAEQGSPSAPEIYVSLSDAQAAFNQPDLINRVDISIAPGADRDAVAANIQQALGDSFQFAAHDSSSVLSAMQVGFAIFDLLGLLALFLGAFLIFNTFRTVIIERRHDIGMLRAIGATRRQITMMIMIESLLQGVLGVLLGLALGYVFAAAVTGFMGQIWATYLNRGALSLQLNWGAVGIAAVSGLATALLAGYLPGRTAGKTSPLEALRPATVASVYRAARWSLIAGVALMALSVLLLLFSGSRGAVGGAVLFLVGMLIAAPGLVIPVARLFSPMLSLWFAREGDLARGNLVRQPGRAAITGSTLMIGLAVLILMAALVLSFNDLLHSLANANFSSDMLLLPQSVAVYDSVIGADSGLAERVRALPEVETVSTLRYASGMANGESLQVLGIDPQTYPTVASLEFSQDTPDSAFASLENGRAAILTSLALSSMGVQVGDDLVLQTAEGPQTYHVVGVGNDILTFKISAIFISHANMAVDFHKTEDIMLLVNLRPDADKALALADVQAITQDYPQFTPHLTGQYRDDLVRTSTSAFGLFYAIALLILIPAALGLLNTLTINILERTREIGMVRAVGGSRSQVRRMVTAEALLLAVFGAAMGILAGVAMSYGFIMAFGTIGWQMPYTFPVLGVVAALVIAVVLALFASILPARSAAKLDIIRALQYE